MASRERDTSSPIVFATRVHGQRGRESPRMVSRHRDTLFLGSGCEQRTRLPQLGRTGDCNMLTVSRMSECAGAFLVTNGLVRWSGSAARCRRVGVETNGSEVVGRGVRVAEGVDRGEGGRRGGSASPALGLCLAPGPDRGLAGVGGFPWDAGRGRRLCSRPVVRGSQWSCRQPGRVGGSQAAPARGGGAGPRAVA